MKKFLSRFFFAVTALVVAWLLVHLVEDVHGAMTLKALKKSRQSLGAQSGEDAWAPSPIPDQDNFAKAPIVLSLLAAKGSPFKVTVNPPKDREKRGNFSQGRPADLLAWAKENNCDDLKAHLKPMALIFKDLDEASRRKGCQLFSGADYESEGGPDNIGILAIRQVGRAIALRALVRLQNHESQNALEDVLLGLRVARQLKNEPDDLVLHTRQGIQGWVMQAAWEGIVSGQWNEGQLAELEEVLGRLDELTALRDFYACRRRTRDHQIKEVIAARVPKEAQNQWRRTVEEAKKTLTGQDTETRETLRKLEAARPSAISVWMSDFLCPKGWILQNQAKIDQIYTEHYLKAVDLPGHRIRKEVLRSLPGWWRKGGRSPYTFLAAPIGMDFETWFFTRTARHQTYLNLARVACALDRYKLAQRRYPDNLKALVPNYITALPVEITTGGPLMYERNDRGSFRLWSRSWDGMDHGGRVPDGGDTPADWVWPTTTR